jgi:hypothetical protein
LDGFVFRSIRDKKKSMLGGGTTVPTDVDIVALVSGDQSKVLALSFGA